MATPRKGWIALVAADPVSAPSAHLGRSDSVDREPMAYTKRSVIIVEHRF